MNEIVLRTTGRDGRRADVVTDAATLIELQELAREVPVASHVADYAVRLVLATHPELPEGVEAARRSVRYGASPRGAQAMILAGDVSQENDVRAMFRQVIDAWGTVDIMVNNAGLQKDAPFEDLSVAAWDLVMNVNLKGQFLCAREAVRLFKRQGIRKGVSSAAGKILCMSSVHDVIPWGGHVNYAASKGGVMMMMKSIAQEVAPWRIRVNSISPGAVRTPINEEAWSTRDAYNALMTLVPYKRIGEPADIGRAAVWLASDDSDYITGATIYVDGGMTLYPGFETGG